MDEDYSVLPNLLLPIANPRRSDTPEMEKRRTVVMQLYLSGLNSSQIYERMIEVDNNYTQRMVAEDIEMEMIKIRRENAQAIVSALNLEIMRLDQLFSVMFAQGLTGDVKSATEARKIIEERAKLLGLYKVGTPKNSDWRDKVLELLESGKVTIEQLKKELGDELTGEILAIRGHKRDKSSSADVIDGTAKEVA